MVLLRAKTAPERLLIPAFVFLLKLYPLARTADPKSATAGAAGDCLLIRRTALAASVKHSGGRIRMGLTRSTGSVRTYTTFGEIRRMIARTAFTHS